MCQLDTDNATMGYMVPAALGLSRADSVCGSHFVIGGGALADHSVPTNIIVLDDSSDGTHGSNLDRGYIYVPLMAVGRLPEVFETVHGFEVKTGLKI